MKAQPSNILIIEDEKNTWADLADFFEPEINQGDITVDFAATAKEGLQKIGDGSINTDLVVIDIILPDIPSDNELYLINSLDKQIVTNKMNIKGVLISAHKDIETLKSIERDKEWILESLAKPFSKKSLKNTVFELLNYKSKNSYLNSIKDEISSELYDEINQHTAQIKFKLRRSVADLIDAGNRIKLVKEKLPHGYFRRWIDSELQVHFSTVANLVRVADVFGDDVEKVTTIGVVPTILYFLAAPSTPVAARQKVIQLIEDGEQVSFAQTKQIIKDYKQKNNVSSSESQTIVDTKENIDNSHPEKQQITKVIRSTNSISQQNQWLLLGDLSIFNGKPDNIEFRQSLPSEIALTIAFPPNKSYSLEQLVPIQSRSFTLFYSPFKDFDAAEFSNMVKDSVELCTEGSEIVLFSYLPGIELIKIAIELGCKCIVAEQDYDKCNSILAEWQQS